MSAIIGCEESEVEIVRILRRELASAARDWSEFKLRTVAVINRFVSGLRIESEVDVGDLKLLQITVYNLSGLPSREVENWVISFWMDLVPEKRDAILEEGLCFQVFLDPPVSVQLVSFF